MKRSLVLAIIAIAAVTHASIVAVAPFAPHRNENFGAIPAGTYANFEAMAGFAKASRVGTAGALQVGDFPFLPSCSVRHALYASGSNVRWTFAQDVGSFGGMFRLTGLGAPVRGAQFRFLDVRGVSVGTASCELSPIAWKWQGFASSVPFRHVEILSVGDVPGYVGMDDLRVGS